jgi:hypothetical protein
MLSIGEAHGVMNNGSAAAFSNPASALLREETSIDLSYGFWVGNISNSFAGAIFRRDQRVIAFSLYSSGSDELEARLQPGPSMGTFNARTIILTGLYGRQINQLSVAASISYLNEEIFQYQANGYSFSAGVLWKDPVDRYRFGLSLEHVGEMQALDLSESLLPSRLRFSGAVHLITASIGGPDDIEFSLRTHIDLVQPISVTKKRDIQSIFEGISLAAGDPFKETALLHTGWIISMNEMIRLQFGYTIGETSRPFSSGIELELLDLTFAYSINPFKTNFGTAHSVGLRIPL